MATGISWPFRREGGGFPATSDDDQQIVESLTTLLQLRRGELVMATDVGGDFRRYLFENNNPALASALQYEVANLIAKYEPRVGLRQINVQQSEGDMLLIIEYFVKATRQTSTLEVPISRT